MPATPDPQSQPEVIEVHISAPQCDLPTAAPSASLKNAVLGILLDPVDYQTAVQRVMDAGHLRKGLTVSALAVHGLMTGVLDSEHKYRLNHFDLLVPDGQPVRWMLNLIHKTRLPDRVYGPNLTLRICEQAAEQGLPIYFYGSTSSVLQAMTTNLRAKFPKIVIAGTEPSKFRRLQPDEKTQVVDRIKESGARIVFVGLGCPRQEVWAYEFRNALSLPVLAVGAAFPFIAGELKQAPSKLQELGLEWLFRFLVEPRRLWKRYLLLNPTYLFLVGLQALGLYRFSTDGRKPLTEVLYG